MGESIGLLTLACILEIRRGLRRDCCKAVHVGIF